MLALTVAVAPQLVGGAHGWSTSIIAAMTALSCAAAVWVARRERRSRPLDLVAAVALSLLAWTALQALPLPRDLAALLQPTAVENLDAVTTLLGDDGPPGWVALTYSPFGTHFELLKGAAILASFFAAWLLAVIVRPKHIVLAVAGSTLLMALVALAHLAADADRVFGVYAPLETNSSLLAPLVNQNHLSGFLAMGVPLWTGLALDQREAVRRWWFLGAGALVGATALLAVSRGGVASLVCGLLVLGALGLLRRRKPKKGSSRSLSGPLFAIVATAATAGGLGLYLASEALYRDFEGGGLDKLVLARRGLELSLAHPLFGVGRGGFSAAFVTMQGGDVRYTHPENFVAQWASEWGVVVGLVALVALGLALVRAVRRSRRWSHLGACAALVSIATHDLVDFSMELTGVAVVVATLAGACLGGAAKARTPRRFGGATAAAVTAGLALLAVLVVGWRVDGLQLHVVEQRLAAGDESFDAVLDDAARAHPAEPSLALLAGAHAVNRDDPSALRWLNRAMQMAPGWDAPHAQTARWLALHGRPTQAFLELREAQERRHSTTRTVCDLLRQRESLALVFARVAPSERWGTEWLDGVAACLPVDSEATAALDEELLSRGRDTARYRAARRALGRDAPQDALEILDDVEEPDLTTARLLRARALVASGRPEEALVPLTEGSDDWGDQEDARLALTAEAYAGTEDVDAMHATLETIRGRAAGQPSGLAASWVLAGRLDESLGNTGQALSAYERALRLDPAPATLVRLARLAERSGHLGRAYRSYSRLCRQEQDQRWCAARDRLFRRSRELSPTSEQLPGTP